MTLPSRTITPDWGQAAEIIERGQARTLGLRLRQGGVVITPTSGSLTIYRDAGESSIYLSTSALTPGAVSTYDLPAVPTTESLSDLWVSLWSWVVSGVTYRQRRRTFLVGYAPGMRLDDTDLYAVVPELRHPARLPAGQTSWGPQILRTWDAILAALTARGKRPWLTIDQADLFAWHQVWAAAEACSAVPADQGTYLPTRARELRADALRAEANLRIEYEDAQQVRASAGRSVISMAPPDGSRGSAW